MWKYYAQDFEVSNLTTGIKHLRCKFAELQYQADYEIAFAKERFFTDEECFGFYQKYERAIRLCTAYLNSVLCLYHFISEMRKLSLGKYFYPIRHFLPENLALLIFNADDDVESDGECQYENIQYTVCSKTISY